MSSRAAQLLKRNFFKRAKVELKAYLCTFFLFGLSFRALKIEMRVDLGIQPS